MQFDVEDGEAWVDCESGWLNLTSNGTEYANGSSYRVMVDQGEIVATLPADAACQAVFPLSKEMPNLRPAPQESFNASDVSLCAQSTLVENCLGSYLTGDLTNDSADVFAINVTGQEVLVLSLVAASADLEISLYLQNGVSESILEQNITTIRNTSFGDVTKVIVPISESGRVVASVTSQSVDTLWMLNAKRFNVDTQLSLNHLDTITAYGRVPLIHNMNYAQSIMVIQSYDSSNLENVNVTFRFGDDDGSWSDLQTAAVGERIRGIPGYEKIEFKWDCDCKWHASLANYNHYDGSLSADAPGMMPLSKNSSNESYPLAVMDGSLMSGELTLGMDDYRDMVKVELTGWNDSIHLIDVKVEGDVTDLKVSIIRIEQNTWEISEIVNKTYSMNTVELSLEAGPGTHFIKIEHIDGAQSIDEEAEPVQWRMEVRTAVMEEGEEPWFAPSEEVQDIAETMRWFMGFSFLIPCLILVIYLQREKRFAQELSSKKDRLSWLRSRLDKGEIVTKDLARSLRAISSLEWEEALQAWGEPCIRHYTEGVDIAIWRLDERIVKGNTWPLLIGINPQKEDWDVAAIRFESPQGKDWNVHKLDPRLLFRNHEIFLDVLKMNARLFIQVELTGEGNSLDLHLSGMIMGEPFAAKPTATLYRKDSEGEEE
tara:strand:- start:1658 stop:3625 length:1968 start_codon:yes stop_codon:yes gene_type:complete